MRRSLVVLVVLAGCSSPPKEAAPVAPKTKSGDTVASTRTSSMGLVRPVRDDEPFQDKHVGKGGDPETSGRTGEGIRGSGPYDRIPDTPANSQGVVEPDRTVALP